MDNIQELQLPDVKLTFEYQLPGKTVSDWWTDLSGKGYVGRSLKSMRQIGKNERGKFLVETKWKVMGMSMKMIEMFTLESRNRWIWEPHMMSIDIMDYFRLEENANGSRLHIISEFHPKGMMGRLSKIMFGRYLRRLMTEEWNAADRVFRNEVGLHD
jgi:hypothetical protein